MAEDRNPTVEVFQGADETWRYRVKGGNGEIVCQSEGYKTQAHAIRGARDLCRCVMGYLRAKLAGDGPIDVP